jgi:hypothetical protein
LSAVEHSITVARQFGPLAPGEPGGPATKASKAQVLDAALAACTAALDATTHFHGDARTLIAQAAAALALSVKLVEPD